MTIQSILFAFLLTLLVKPTFPTPVPIDRRLTEADQELDDARFVGIHRISARVRGVRGLGSTLYWVSADGQRVTAYRRGRQLWQTAVTPPFQHQLPKAVVTTLILCSNTVFIGVGTRGHLELNRQTGRIQAFGIGP